MPFGPVVDFTNSGMPMLPIDSIKANEHVKNVPLMLGTAANEGSLFVPLLPSIIPGLHLPLQTDDFETIMHYILDPVVGNEMVTSELPELHALYPIGNYKSVDDQMAKVIRDYMFLCPTRRAARAVVAAENAAPVYLYQFGYINKWLDFKVGGDYHCSEIYFVFGNAWPPVIHRFSRTDDKMVETMQSCWTNFAKNGNPGNDWPAYEIETDQHMFLDYPPVAGSGLEEASCDYHDKMLGY